MSWSDLARVFVVAVLAYLAVVVLLRGFGQRTLSKMNAFDLVVTVALGSTLATIVLSRDVALAEGMVAFITLMGLQFAITWSSVRSARISSWVKSDPSLLFYRGQYLHANMRRARTVEAEILSAVRNQGIASLDEVAAVVLETDGSFSVVPTTDKEAPSAFADLLGSIPQ